MNINQFVIYTRKHHNYIIACSIGILILQKISKPKIYYWTCLKNNLYACQIIDCCISGQSPDIEQSIPYF